MTGKVKLASRDGAVSRYRHDDSDNLTFHWYRGTRFVSVVKRGIDIDGIVVAASGREPTENEVITAIEGWVQEHS